MRFFKGFRARAIERFMRIEGCELVVAELAAIGVYPFENRHASASRHLEHEVRALSHLFNGHVWTITDAEVLRTAARTAVKTYLKLAEEEEDGYYEKAWRDALDAIGRAGEDSGLMFTPDSISDRRLAAQATHPDQVDLDPSRLRLPNPLFERAVEQMLEWDTSRAEDPWDASTENRLTRENAERWIEWVTLHENRHYGWLAKEPDKSNVEPVPNSGRYLDRDWDASSAVWNALEEQGFDPKNYWRSPPFERALQSETARDSKA